MKKLVAMGIVVGLIAGCTNNVEYTFGDALRIRVHHAAPSGERGERAERADDAQRAQELRNFLEIRARFRERCKTREGKLAMSFRGIRPVGVIFKGSTPTLSCAT